MRPARFDRRRSGISMTGELPWGSHFCQFYRTEKDILEILIPYFKAGLAGNELCWWTVSGPLDIETAWRAMEEAEPRFSEYMRKGQLEIEDTERTIASDVDAEARLMEKLDRAVERGFDGVRLALHVQKGSAGARCIDAIRRHNAIAAFLYPRDRFDAVGLMDVVKNHRFALVHNAGRWEILESSEARTVEDALERTEEKLHYLFDNMSEGFAYHRIVLDDSGKPRDYVFLETNEAFEKLTGLRSKKIVGKSATQVLPGIERDQADWIGRYGRVAMTRKPAHFEGYSGQLGRWYSVSAFSPQKGYFAVTFMDITDRRNEENARRAIEERLRVTLRSIGDAVIATDSSGKVVLLNRVAEELTGWKQAEALDRPLAEVFHIVNEDTGEKAEDPVRRVIESGVVVGLANHTTLVARDGRRLAIADSAAPVRGDDGVMIGVVLVFRDVTAQRRAEQEREMTVEFLRLVNANAGAEDLIRAAAVFFKERSRCEAVGIRLKQGDDYPYYEARGFPEEFLLLENSLCARDEDGTVFRDHRGDPVIECMCGNVICGRTNPEKTFFTANGSFWTNSTTELLASTTEADRQTHTRNRCNGQGYESVALVPLRVGAERLGLLQLNDHRKGMFTPDAVAVWERLGDHLAVAVARARAHEALGASEQRFKAIAAKTPDHILIQDRDLRYTMVINPQLGLSERDMLGKTDCDILAAEDAEKLTPIKKRVLETGESVHVETSAKGKDGELQFFDGSYVALLDAGGRPAGIIGYFRNVTDREKARTELEGLSVQRQLALDAARLGWWCYDPVTRVSMYDKRYTEIFGVSGDRRDNDEILKLLHPEDLPRVRADVEAALDPVNPRPYSTEYRVIRPDGETRWVEAHGIASFEASGAGRRATGLVGTVEDITERRSAVQVLRSARDELDRKVKERTAELETANRTLRMISACNEVLVRATEEGGLVRRICGIIHELGGYRMVWVGYAEQDEAKSVRPVASVGFEDGYLETARITWADDERGRGPTGTCIRTGAVGVCRDFHTDPALAPWRDQAVKRGYRSSIALPLRTGDRVFGAMTIYAEAPGVFDEGQVGLLCELADDLSLGITALRIRTERDRARREAENRAEQLRALAMVLGQTEQRERQRLARMLHDQLQQLLVAAKFLVGALTGSPNVEEGCRHVMEVLDQAIQAGRSLTVELAPPILREKGLAVGLEWLSGYMREKYGLTVEVQSSPGRLPLSQPVLNFIFETVRELLFNVVKHARVKSARVTTERNAGEVVVTVRDDGVGFDAGRERESGTGSGFGLFSIRERAGYFGCRLVVESIPGHGSRFMLIAPLGDVQAEPVPLAEPRAGREVSARRTGSEQAAGEARKARVLLADDHAVVRKGLALLLQDLPDIDVVGEADDGMAALEMARRLQPTVVVMDISMPVMDGVEATKAIRAEMPQIEVVVLSMHDDPAMDSAVRGAGARTLLSKAGPSDALISAIRSAAGLEKEA